MALTINKQAFSAKDIDISILGISIGSLESITELTWSTNDEINHQNRIGSAVPITTSRGKQKPTGSMKLQEWEYTSIINTYGVTEFKFLPTNCTIQISYNPEGENPSIIPRIEQLIGVRFGKVDSSVGEDDGAVYKTIEFIYIKPSGPLAF